MNIFWTQIPVCLWFLSRNKAAKSRRDRRGETLFIDARKLGTMIDRVHRELTEADITQIAETYHAWRGDIRSEPSPPTPLPLGEGCKSHYRGGLDFSGLVERARELRKKQTPAEAIMWELLRNRQFLNLKFRRQHQYGLYIADFYCDEHKLVVELDGGVHQEKEQIEKDKTRDAYMQSQGLSLIRIPNEDVLNHPESVLKRIAALLPSSSGRGAGGEGIHPSSSGRGAGGEGITAYRDIPGFCKSATLADIRHHGHILTPGRYVGAAEVEDDGEPFDDKMKRLTEELRSRRNSPPSWTSSSGPTCEV